MGVANSYVANSATTEVANSDIANSNTTEIANSGIANSATTEAANSDIENSATIEISNSATTEIANSDIANSATTEIANSNIANSATTEIANLDKDQHSIDFHVVVNRIHVDYAALLWWDFLHCVQQKKDQIQYLRFTKLTIADLMKKFSSIAQRLEGDYHSVKDDILRNQFTQGTIRTPSAHRTPTPTTIAGDVVQKNTTPIPTLSNDREREEESYASEFVNSVFQDDDDDSDNRIEPESHKKHSEMVDDDDENEKEKKDDNDDDINDDHTDQTLDIT
ncbi:hypothetical protein Tco_0705015 [Tanacetum coccineum]|uniref:Uncharacterized protein n=1 Tax=Tanacetum coccineum TaxID=301880 RepID=A0ABQ4Y3C7_9ASTR